MGKDSATPQRILVAFLLIGAGVALSPVVAALAPAAGMAAAALAVPVGEWVLKLGQGLITDEAKARLAKLCGWEKKSVADSAEEGLKGSAARAIAAVLAEAAKEFAGDAKGKPLLSQLAELDRKDFIAAMEGEGAGGLRDEDLLALVGAAAGDARGVEEAAKGWRAFLRAARLHAEPGANVEALSTAQRSALDFAAQRLAERFGAEFNNLLRANQEHGAPALVAAQAMLLRGIADKLSGVEATTKEMRTEQRQISRWLIGEADALTAKAIDRRIATDGTLPEQLAELRTVAWTSHGKIDAVFKATSKLLANTEEIRTIVAGGPKLRSLRLPKPDRPRMLYSARRVPMVGRDRERAELRAFLYGDQPVSWWLWHGPAGMGKSRLALELCREIDRSWVAGLGETGDDRSGWVAGFLEAEASTRHDWSKWKPAKPTLIVIEYALARAEMFRPWIAHVSEAAETHNAANAAHPFPPVRFLLLDRLADELLLRQFTAAGADSLRIEHTQYRDPMNRAVPPRALGEFTDAQLEEMVGCVYSLHDQTGPATRPMAALPKPDEIVAAFRTEKRTLRPLFVTLAADAVCNGEAIGELKEEKLARDWLTQELQQWAEFAQQPNAETRLMEQFRAITALATMAGSLWYKEGYSVLRAMIAQGDLAGAFPDVGDFGRYERLMPWIFSLGEGNPPEMIPPLEPDYFGELLVLEHLKDRAARATLRHGMLRAACVQNSAGLGYLLMRISEDFPEHPITQSIFDDLLLDDETSPFVARNESTWTDLRSIWAWQFRNTADHNRLERLFERAASVREPKAYLLAAYASFLINTKKNIQSGISVFERMVKLYSHDARPKLVYAVQLAELDHDLPRAEKLFTEALSIKPDDADYLWHYAQFMAIKRQRFPAALSSIRRAIAIEPHRLRHYLMQCNILYLWMFKPDRKELERYRVFSRFKSAVSEYARVLSTAQLSLQEKRIDYEPLIALSHQLLAFGARSEAVAIVRDLAKNDFAVVGAEFRPAALVVAKLCDLRVGNRDPLVLLARDLEQTVKVFSTHEFSRNIVVDESASGSEHKWMARLIEVLQGKAEESTLDDWPEWQEAKAEAERMDNAEIDEALWGTRADGDEHKATGA